MECTNDKKFFKTIVNLELVLDILDNVNINFKNNKYGHIYGFINLTNIVSNEFKFFQINYVNSDFIVIYFDADQTTIDLYQCMITKIHENRKLVIDHLIFFAKKYASHIKNSMNRLENIMNS